MDTGEGWEVNLDKGSLSSRNLDVCVWHVGLKGQRRTIPYSIAVGNLVKYYF